MKKILTLALLALSIAAVKAQTSNVILFTENGERFFVILNGLRQNETAGTNVKLTDLTANFYKMKIIFEDKTLGEKNFNLAFNSGMETSYMIKKNKKGEFVLRPVSETPMAQSSAWTAEQTEIAAQPVTPLPEPATQTTTTTTTTTTTGNGTALPQGGGVSMGINVNDNGGSFNMNVSGGMVDYGGATTTTQTTVTQSSVSTSHNDMPPAVQPPPSYLPGYSGPVGCPAPMHPQDFADLKNSIASKSFEDSKMTIAKQVLADNCLFVSQVRDLMDQFTFEQSKLEFAKYAYDYTYDTGNYFKINDAFTFESSIDELNRYITTRR